MKKAGKDLSDFPHARLLLIIFFILVTTIIPGCGVYDLAKCLSAQEDPERFEDEITYDRLETFPPQDDTSNFQHDYVVFETKGNGRKAQPLLLLHELPGLTKKTLHFAEWLSTQGFTVYAPLLFGEVGVENIAGGFINYFTSQEWIPFVVKTVHYRHLDGRVEEFPGETRPIHEWLRKFIREKIEPQHSDQAIGVVGMCLTGATPLALLENPKIHRVVVAQPTLPFMFWGTMNDKKSLGLSEMELNNAIKRVQTQNVKILGTRFLHDCLAKREKHIYMQTIFGDNFVGEEVLDYLYPDGTRSVQYRAHSTLVGEWQDNTYHPSQRLREKVVEFLRKGQEYFDNEMKQNAKLN